MRMFFIVIGLILVAVMEQWWGYWLRWWGVPLPAVALALLIGCLGTEPRWWPWLGLVVGVTQDICGLGLIGQFSVWWWLWMCGAWWLEGRLARESVWRWLILVGWMALCVLLLPWYESMLSGMWEGWWPGLLVMSLGSMALFAVLGWPLAWLLKQRNVDIGSGV